MNGNKREELEEAIKSWMLDGGGPTLESFMKLDEKEREMVFHVLESAIPYDEIQLNGTDYFLAHTVPEKSSYRNRLRSRIRETSWLHLSGHHGRILCVEDHINSPFHV